MATVMGQMEENLAGAVALAVAGDEAAFARIIRAHHDDMTRVCFVICGDLDVADEAVQAAWPIIWHKLGSLRDPDRLRPWLVSVAANEARQLSRRRRRRTVVELSIGDAAASGVDPAGRVGDLDRPMRWRGSIPTIGLCSRCATSRGSTRRSSPGRRDARPQGRGLASPDFSTVFERSSAMTDRLDFETRLEERLRARAALASRPFDAAAIARRVVERRRRRRRIGSLEWPSTRPALAWLVVGLLLVIALLGAVATVGALLRQRPPVPPSSVSNGWIAYSTDGQNPGSTDVTTGSDIYLVREGGEPRLIAGRQGGTTRNVCPAFSPDGTRLAFGVASNQGRAVVVLGLDANGAIGDTVHITVPGSGPGVCVRWSSDGTRVGYLDGGIVVVRGLDGSTPPSAVGDPGVQDLERGRDPTVPLLSPAGDRIARIAGQPGPGCQIVVSRPDGTAAHAIAMALCGYAIAAWSPDGRQVLLLQEVGSADFALQAIAVDSLFQVTIVSTVRTNGARSEPGRGDVSWQPVFP